MVKHITLLSLCIMFYAVGNIDAYFSKIHQFNRAVECYRQMFGHKLIVGSTDYQNNGDETYDTVVANFLNGRFRDTSTSRADILKGNLPSDYKDKQNDITKTSDDIIESIITLFIFNAFKKTDDFDTRINNLKEELDSQVLIINPLRTFIKGYGTNEFKFTCASPNIFCHKYRNDENLAKDG